MFFIGLNQNALQNAQGDAAKHSTINLACFTAKNAVQSAFVFPQGPMETRRFALATIAGRLSVEDPNAHKTTSAKITKHNSVILLFLAL